MLNGVGIQRENRQEKRLCKVLGRKAPDLRRRFHYYKTLSSPANFKDSINNLTHFRHKQIWRTVALFKGTFTTSISGVRWHHD